MPEPKFAASRMTHDAVALEIGLVQLDDSQGETFELFWQQLDHQKLELSSRQALDRNGLRVALMPSQPSALFLELTQPRPIELESLDLVEQQRATKGVLDRKPRLISHQRIVNRRGDTYKIETSELRQSHEWRIRRADQDVYGSGELVLGVFELNTAPQNDGTAMVRLTPRINYGPIQTTIGVGEGDFAYDAGQAGQSLAELAVEVVLRPGETLVMAPTPDRNDLGHLFFDSIATMDDPNRTSSHLTHRVLLVRLVQTQLDDLFGKSFSDEPLTTGFRH